MDGHIYIGEKLQKDVDAATFEYITDYFYKDKNHVYYYDRFSEEEAHFLMVEGYDVATLKGDSNRFMMDKDYYYYGYDNSIYAKNLTSQQIEILKQGKTSLKDLLSSHKEPPQKRKSITIIFIKWTGIFI